MFTAGAAEVVITPPVGTFLEGYGARTSPSVAVHDDLCARAVVLDDGETRAALAACDLIGIDRRLTASVRERVAAATDIPGEHVMVCATHTHGGPAGLRADVDPELTENTARLIAGAIIAAHGRRRPAVVKAGHGAVDTVSQNRRDPAGPIDPAMTVVLLDSPAPHEPPIASIVNFACHATVLFHTNLEISADYPGYAVRTVKKVLGDAPVLFLNGACGDVNPVWIEQRFEEAERVGSIVGAEAARRLQELRPLGAGQKAWNIRWEELTDKPVSTGRLIEEPSIRVVSHTVDVPLRRLDPPEEYERLLRELRDEIDAASPTDVERRRALMARWTRLAGERGVAGRIRPGGGTLHPEIQVIALGDEVAILGLPGEFFSETGQAIREAAGQEYLMVSCYTNHHVFYVVPHHAFDEGGYEPGVAVLDETADETFRRAAINLLNTIPS